MSTASARTARKVAKAAKGLYRGYIPPDLPQNRPRNRIKPWWKVLGKPRLTVYPKPEVEEWANEPEYPPLNDATTKGMRSQVRYDWYESLKTLPTAEQKLYEVGRHTTHRMAHISNWLPVCQPQTFVQYLTQTHVINSLPDSYSFSVDSENEKAEKKTQIGSLSDLERKVEHIVLEQVLLDRFESKKIEDPPFISKSSRDGNKRAYISNTLVQNIYNQIKKVIVFDANPQHLEYQIDYSPAIRSWWYHSGFQPPNKNVFYRGKKDEEGNINTIFQMDGASALNLRSNNFIKPFVKLDDSLVTDTSTVEKFGFNPHHYGAVYKFKWPVSLPGFWFEDTPQYDCPHTCFLTTDSLKLRQSNYRCFANAFNDQEDFLTSQALLTSFCWLNSLSMYHGYTPFQEIDYPFTCQVITTDGQFWLFNVYQLNSHSFHRDFGGPKRNNICWSSGLMKLFDNYNDGKFDGINSDVSKILTRFMSQQTSADYTQQLKLRPFLSSDTRSEEERIEMRKQIREQFEGRNLKFLKTDWSVPLYEHIFFRSKQARNQLTHMKPKFRRPLPKYPKIFD